MLLSPQKLRAERRPHAKVLPSGLSWFLEEGASLVPLQVQVQGVPYGSHLTRLCSVAGLFQFGINLYLTGWRYTGETQDKTGNLQLPRTSAIASVSCQESDPTAYDRLSCK